MNAYFIQLLKSSSEQSHSFDLIEDQESSSCDQLQQQPTHNLVYFTLDLGVVPQDQLTNQLPKTYTLLAWLQKLVFDLETSILCLSTYSTRTSVADSRPAPSTVNTPPLSGTGRGLVKEMQAVDCSYTTAFPFNCKKDRKQFSTSSIRLGLYEGTNNSVRTQTLKSQTKRPNLQTEQCYTQELRWRNYIQMLVPPFKMQVLKFLNNF